MGTYDIKKNAEELGKKAHEEIEKAKEMLNPDEMKQKVSKLGEKAQETASKAKEMLNSEDLKKKANEIGENAQEQFKKAKEFLKSDDLGQKSKEAFENLKGQVSQGDSATKKKLFAAIGSIAAILILAFFFLSDSGDVKEIKKFQLPVFNGKSIENALSDYKYFSDGSWSELAEEKQNEYKNATQAASYMFSSKKNKINIEFNGFACYTTKYTGLHSDIIPETVKKGAISESFWNKISKKLNKEIGNVQLSIHFGIIETQQAAKMVTMGIDVLEKLAENNAPKSKYIAIPLSCIITYKKTEFKINNDGVLKAISQNIPINLYTGLPSDTLFAQDLSFAIYEEMLEGLKGKQFAYILGDINNRLSYRYFNAGGDIKSGIIHFPIVLGKVEDVKIDEASKTVEIKVNSQIKNITLADLNISYHEVNKYLSKSDGIVSVEKADNLQSIDDILIGKIPNYVFSTILFSDAKNSNRRLMVEFDNINNVYLNTAVNDKTISFMQQRYDKFAESNTDFLKDDGNAKSTVFHNLHEGIVIDKKGISFENENGTATLSYRDDYEYHLDVVTSDNSCTFTGICRPNRVGTIYCTPDEQQIWNKKYIVVDFRDIGGLEITKSDDKQWCKGNGSIKGSYGKNFSVNEGNFTCKYNKNALGYMKIAKNADNTTYAIEIRLTDGTKITPEYVGICTKKSGNLQCNKNDEKAQVEPSLILRPDRDSYKIISTKSENISSLNTSVALYNPDKQNDKCPSIREEIIVEGTLEGRYPATEPEDLGMIIRNKRTNRNDIFFGKSDFVTEFLKQHPRDSNIQLTIENLQEWDDVTYACKKSKKIIKGEAK